MFLNKCSKRIIFLLAGTMLLLVNLAVYSGEAEDLAAEISGKKMVVAEEMAVIVEQHLSIGADLYSKRDFDRALDEFNTVLEIDPANEKARDSRLQCINAIAGKGVVSADTEDAPAVVAAPIQAKTSDQAVAIEEYRKGLKALKMNLKDQACDFLRKSIAHDPFYVPSKRLLRRILELENEDIDRDHDILWEERVNDVRKGWLPTGRANKITTAGPSKQNEIMSDGKRRMIEASKQIIPEINFTQAHLRDVLQYLSKITGVNIILDEHVFDTAFKPNAAEEGEANALQVDSMSGDTITISLINIPLIEVLRYILKIKGLKHRIDDFAILVSTAERIGSDEMETRYYHLSAGIGEFTEFKLNQEATNVGAMHESAGSEGSFGGDAMAVEDKVVIKDVLLNSGVPFPPGSSVFMDKRTGTLIVHNTPENLTMVEKILEIIDKPPFQVNIQAKFVRIGQSDLEELGFEWLLSSAVRVGKGVDGVNKYQIDADTDDVQINNALGGTAENGIDYTLPNLATDSSLFALSGILTDPQYKVIMHALDKSGNSDLLSAPAVTTVNNQQAQIELVDEIRYPNEYDLQPPVITDGKSFTPGLSVPGDFVTRDVGVILNVTPSVGADRKTITLTLIPEVSELVGWKDFGIDFSSIYTDEFGNLVSAQQHIPLEQPTFRTSNVSTTVIVNDGETIVLGGLIEEKKKKVHDKTPILGDIPLLGRLFRHNYEQSQKMNLMIFVTAKLINADGEDLHNSQVATNL